jgi:DNA-binding NarL/FixJ family response regulator
LLAACLENKEIASELGVSMPVAAKIIRSVFLKLGVHRRSEAILRWKLLE